MGPRDDQRGPTVVWSQIDHLVTSYLMSDISAVCGWIFKILKPVISYGSPIKRPSRSEQGPTVVWSQVDHLVTKVIIQGLRVSDVQF